MTEKPLPIPTDPKFMRYVERMNIAMEVAVITLGAIALGAAALITKINAKEEGWWR